MPVVAWEGTQIMHGDIVQRGSWWLRHSLDLDQEPQVSGGGDVNGG